MEILAAGHFENPEDGFGLQQAVLEEVAAGERGPAALTWTSSRYLAPTSREKRLPGFEKGVEVAHDYGFPVLVRNSGGGAVAANEGSVSFSLTFPVEDLRHGLYERYAEGVGLISAALRRLGVPAEPGEVAGEFCPGAYSIRSGGEHGVKHAGLAQRVKRRAARLEALILVSNTAGLVPVLQDFYGALGLPFRPESIADIEVPVRQVVNALYDEVQRWYGATETPLNEESLARARALRGTWRV
ncbi:MAG: biotin/lipoate A/B protein ligase family protein [Rubrobacteraceae bacterium]